MSRNSDSEGRLEVDVLVVGAGPAGSAAASEAARAGARVLLVERKRSVGSPVRCAEYVPLGAADLARVEPGCIAQRVAGLVTHLPSGATEFTASPGYLVHRELFERDLAGDAIEAGAVLWTEARADFEQANGVRIARRGSSELVRTAVLVGADGPRSAVARWLGNGPQKAAVGVQYKVQLARPLPEAHVYFGERYSGGYGWLFPKGGSANLGAALDPSLGGHPRKAVDQLLSDLVREGTVLGGIRRRTGGLIPIGGPRSRIQSRNALLAGDAAGQTHPITGAGVYHALVCGRIAGRLAARAASGDRGALGEYEGRCNDALGEALMRGLARRRRLSVAWTAGRRGDDLIRETWIAFHEYYRASI